MKKYIYIVCILMGCSLLAYFPAEKAIENDAQNVIEEDSVKYREEAIRKLDEVFEGSTLDNFGCVLYYNTIPNFKFVSPSEKKQFFREKTWKMRLEHTISYKEAFSQARISCE